MYRRTTVPHLAGGGIIRVEGSHTPAKSEAQRHLFALAEHHPDQLYAKNSGLANLSHQTLHDFASTKHLADGAPTGGKMTNTTFQQSERMSGKRPAWMEKATGSRATAAPAPKVPAASVPAYRVKSKKVTVAEPVKVKPRMYMADGGKPEKWASEAFKPSHKGMLHKALSVPLGEKIPASKMSAAAHSKSAHVRHMAQAARNI